MLRSANHLVQSADMADVLRLLEQTLRERQAQGSEGSYASR